MRKRSRQPASRKPLTDIGALIGLIIRARNIGEAAWRYFLVRGLSEDDPRRTLIVSKFNVFGAPTASLWVLPVYNTDDEFLVEIALVAMGEK